MNCTDCVFFQSVPPWHRINLPEGEWFGECRRNPPIASSNAQDRRHQLTGIFPTVKAKDWCGEFAPSAEFADQRRDDEANAAFDAAARHDAQSPPCRPLAASANGCPNDRPLAWRRYSPAI